MATKLHIPLIHIEAGCRSFDRKMPEEINRVLVDHISNYLFCIDNHSLHNLKKEGIIDPTKVTRAALENAASVAGTVLLTECVVVNDPKEKKDDQMAMNPMMGM